MRSMRSMNACVLMKLSRDYNEIIDPCPDVNFELALTFNIELDLGDCTSGNVEPLTDVVASIIQLDCTNYHCTVIEDSEPTVVLIGKHERLLDEQS